MEPPRNNFGMTHKESADHDGVATSLCKTYQTSETLLSNSTFPSYPGRSTRCAACSLVCPNNETACFLVQQITITIDLLIYCKITPIVSGMVYNSLNAISYWNVKMYQGRIMCWAKINPLFSLKAHIPFQFENAQSNPLFFSLITHVSKTAMDMKT